jgi:hypothetical protein
MSVPRRERILHAIPAVIEERCTGSAAVVITPTLGA